MEKRKTFWLEKTIRFAAHLLERLRVCSVFLPLQAAEWLKSKMKNFKQKKSKFKILSYSRDIYPKRKLRTCTIQIQLEKVWIFAKKRFFFQFFWFSRHARGPPEIFDVHFFESFKKNSKNGFTGSYQTLKGTKSWILVNLAQILWKRQTIFDHLGHNGPPAWNRVKPLSSKCCILYSLLFFDCLKHGSKKIFRLV